jgi:hypothetical protein
MDLAKLYDILADTTVQFRKGPVYAGTPGLVGQRSGARNSRAVACSRSTLCPTWTRRRPA